MAEIVPIQRKTLSNQSINRIHNVRKPKRFMLRNEKKLIRYAP